MPINAPAAPPKGRARTSSATAQKSVAINQSPLTGKAAEWAEGLQGWFGIGQIACIARGNFADAGAIGKHSDTISVELARAATTMPPIIGKGLDILAMTGPYAALFGAVLPLAIQIGVNHGIVPDGVPMQGVVPKAALEAEIAAEVAQIQMTAIRAQKEAEATLAQLKAEMNGKAEA